MLIYRNNKNFSIFFVIYLTPLMAVAAHIEGKLVLDVFGESKDIECELYSIKNNILVYIRGHELYLYDLINNTTLKNYHVFAKVCDLKQSDNGKIVGVLNEKNVLFVFDTRTELIMEQNVKMFDISNLNLAYTVNDDIVLQRLYASSPYHRSKDVYSSCYVFDDFCVLSTRKSIKDNHHKIFKIDEKETVEIGVFQTMEQFSCKINTENTHLLIRLATSYVKNSYFAHTELFLYEIKTKTFVKVQKLYNISDIEFIDGGFVVIFGSQPSNVINFDYKMNAIKRFPKGLRNQMYFNPQCSIVALAGFGQLSGDIEIYCANSLEKYAEICELGANDIKWDVNGSYFYVSTTKYLKEDNKITMYDYFGRKVKEQRYEALISSEVYGNDSTFMALKPPNVPVRIIKDVYVPPHLSNKSTVVHKKVNRVKTDPKNKNDVKTSQPETVETLNKLLKDIETLKERLKLGETLTTKEMNLLLKEDSIKNKLKKHKD